MPSTLDRLVGGAVGPFVHNGSATRDPTVTDDSSLGYQPGSMWNNITAGQLRLWICRASTVGAASWQFMGADFANGGTEPASAVTSFGAGNAPVSAGGNLFRSASAGVTCGGSGNDFVLGVYTIPGNSFDIAGRGIGILAQGSFGGNTNSKRIKIVYNPAAAVIGQVVNGGTIIADTGFLTTNGSGWSVSANIYKYGNPNSNTQVGLHQSSQAAAAVQALQAPTLLTATENAAIIVAVTGNPGTLPGDISMNLFEVSAFN
jgi:hypothetical protein